MAFPLTPTGQKTMPAKPAPSGGELPSYAKGGNIKQASYAEGGRVLGRTEDFMKAPDRFREQDANGRFTGQPPVQRTSDEWGKDEKPHTGAITAPKAPKTKSLKAIKPRK